MLKTLIAAARLIDIIRHEMWHEVKCAPIHGHATPATMKR